MVIHNPILTGSFTVNNIDVSSITSSAANITALNATTASLNSFSASVLTFTSSAATRLGALEAATASLYTATSSFSGRVGALESYTSSLNNKTASFATTGSNIFIGTQTISGSVLQSGSFTSTGILTAQTLVVQTITSSVVYSSGSNIFGNVLNNTQTFTGSVLITGSLTIAGGSSASSYSGATIYGSTVVCAASMCITGNTCFGGMSIINSCLGIGTITPSTKLDVYAGADATSNLVLWGQTIRNEGNGAATGYGAGLKLKISSDAGPNEVYKWAGIAAVAGTNYSNRTDLVLFANAAATANAIEKVRITGDGYVGINTCAPSNLLHIEASNNTTNQFRVNSCDGLNAGLRSYTTSDCSGLIINHYYAVSGAPYLRTSDFVSNQGDSAATQMRFFTKAASANAALAMLISSGGCIGIGTSSPSSLLEVQNCINSPYLNTNTLTSGQWLRVSNPSSCTGATSGILFQAQGPGGGNGLATINGSVVSCGSMSLTFATRDCSGNVEEKMRIVSSGTVAIGTQTATPLPHTGAREGGLIVQGLGTYRGMIEVWDGVSGKAVFQQVGGTTYIGNLCKGVSGGDLRLLINGSGTSATEAMVITCQGRVLINNSAQNGCADYSRMTISGTCSKSTSGAGVGNSVLHLTSCENDFPFGMKFAINGNACSTSRYVSIQTGDHNISNQGNIVFQESGGNIGIGTSSPSTILEIKGTNTYNKIAACFFGTYNSGFAFSDYNSGITYDAGSNIMCLYSNYTGYGGIVLSTCGSPRVTVGINGSVQYNGNFNNGTYYTADTTPSMCMLAPGQCINFCYMSGMLVVNDWNNGSTTLYLAGGGSTTMVANAVSQTGCFWYNPGVVGYSWSNTSGATRCYGFFVIRTRPNA
jgi:hypothetical protein